MDGSTVDHSDSDSGESWTLLENQPAYGDDAPDFPEHSPISFERDHIETQLEKDEDTDGISIISDSDPESSPCDITCDKCSISESCQQSHEIQNLLSVPQPENKKTFESLCNEDDFLGDSSHKHKTYVHRRNKRLSMVLNIIMLGSVITAAGVAIGHMWGAKHECTIPTPSVNKILSNLYKLQEENTYLRNKLKEMTALADSIQEAQQPKANAETKTLRQQRCKKVFEGPLSNKVEKVGKCVDPDNKESVKMLDNSELLPHEKEFLNDIGKLKKVYNQNKSWLDDQIHRRLDNENNLRNKRNVKDYDDTKENISHKGVKHGPAIENIAENHGNSHHVPNIDFRMPETGRTKSHKAWNLRKQIGATKKVDKKNKELEQVTKSTDSKKSHKVVIKMEVKKNPENFEEISSAESFVNIENDHQEDNLKVASQIKEKKVSYADSLKTDSDGPKVLHQINNNNIINNSNDRPLRGRRPIEVKSIKRYGDTDLLSNLISSSEEDIKKDDRYAGPKMKRDKKKHDRHKIHKKQKRKNKYEQWEMKGGYMKDFDEFSMTSSQINLGSDIINAPERKYLNNDFENYLNKLTDKNVKNPTNEENKEKKGEKGKKTKNKDLEWYDKRYALRAEARRKLEQELFGESSPNNAAWYFRRMNKREQCRAQKDNSTFKKFSKQKMNYKMKH